MSKLHIKLKNGEDREYYWHEVDFMVTPSLNLFIVHDATSKTLLFAAHMSELAYYERIEE